MHAQKDAPDSCNVGASRETLCAEGRRRAYCDKGQRAMQCKPHSRRSAKIPQASAAAPLLESQSLRCSSKTSRHPSRLCASPATPPFSGPTHSVRVGGMQAASLPLTSPRPAHQSPSAWPEVNIDRRIESDSRIVWTCCPPEQLSHSVITLNHVVVFLMESQEGKLATSWLGRAPQELFVCHRTCHSSLEGI